MNRLFSLIICAVLVCSCTNIQSSKPAFEEKFKGMNYTGPSRGPFGEEPFESMMAIGSNFVALVPEAVLYQNTLEIRQQYSGERAWYGETTEAVLEGIMQARKIGLQVMIKPHLYAGLDLSGWEGPAFDRSDAEARKQYYEAREEYIEGLDLKTVKRTKWRGDLMTKDEEGWQIFEKNYKEYILSFAELADTMDVELFCIGTELKAMALAKPDYWKELIAEVRMVYKGPITYAANWDSFDQISFWDELDFIGIDAYFPLGDHQIPTVEETVEEWKDHKNTIERTQLQYNKPIIFTEWGYESEEYAGKTPWGSEGVVNAEVQANLYEATFQSFWNEPWFQGVFVWRWSPNDEFGTGTYNFSPKDQPASDVLEKWFKSGG